MKNGDRLRATTGPSTTFADQAAFGAKNQTTEVRIDFENYFHRIYKLISLNLVLFVASNLDKRVVRPMITTKVRFN